MGRYDKSIAIHDEACRVLSGGVSSNFRYQTNPVPLCFERGEGAYVWDVDGNRYIDYMLGNGPAILGHSPGRVIEAVRASLDQGQAFTALHSSELALAQRLCEIIPCAEQVRFDISGTQADQIAIRLARAHTGRELILKFEGQYHGWADNILASVTPGLNEAGPPEAPATVGQSRGQPETAIANVVVQPFNDLARLEETVAARADQLAAIVLEPIACNTGVIEPRPGYLEGLRELCDRHGIVLIFDEVITGFRAALGGAQARYGVTPDLAVFAKAAAAGFAISIVAGRRDIMDGVTSGVLHGGTYNGLTSSVAACAATIAELAEDDGALLAAMEARGRSLMAGLDGLGRKHGLPLHIQGIGTVFSALFTPSSPLYDYRGYKASDEAMRLGFVEELQHRGVRTTGRGTWFVCSELSDEDVRTTLEAADEALAVLSSR
ncbi:MAG TPA: aspartate aminotransferase family protein [Alphaproteobacteria bacterium]|jgi:glutamate-1-semialdehyde 2,1-aminomutase|nr:aspartate aminotransferase family protein [Alphaproteobacteria bacterium]MDP7163956.1 aspartate aminotransferase family protein [Alphaproteobacteria bacterium]MDP7429251.1 aspartate aminotransferase family protein [Alphaproteobacteria bacterium]HJM52045.1 aspartate aminotransferase family protein [Alphaproteobacteria bacterium]